MWLGVAALDANLLVPIVACDFLLTAFDHRLFEPIVSSTVLDEVERTLIDDFPHIEPAEMRRRVDHMRIALADQIIDPAGLTRLAEGINTKDRHVVAAALAAEATWMVTNDGQLRAEIDDSALGLESLDGNAFAMRLWNASSADVSDVILALIAKRHRQPVSPTEMAAQLGAHFPAMAAAWLVQHDETAGSAETVR